MSEPALHILVVDDEAAVREVLEMRLEAWGYRVSLAVNVAQAQARVAEAAPDVVISDVVLPDASGLQLLRRLKEGDPGRPVILITSYGTIDAAVEAMKLGAHDFLTKPLDVGKLQAQLSAIARDHQQRCAVRRLDQALDAGPGLGELVGASPEMRAVYSLIESVAGRDAGVLITGESGTGKELVARAIHDLSRQRSGPFVAVNAAAIPEGLTESELFGHERGAFTGAVAARPGYFEQADGGTLFLDEITEMPIALQPKFLRVLEEGVVRRLGASRPVPFAVRVIAATNRDPMTAVKDGLLRADVYYRLAVFTITLPPLYTRGGDIELLAHRFVRLFNTKHGAHVEGVSPKANVILTNYQWPGNVRELRNVMERAVILSSRGFIEPAHLPPFLLPLANGGEEGVLIPLPTTAAEAEKLLIMETLKRVGNNKAEAARRLGFDVKTIRNKLKAYGQEVDEE